MNSKENMYKVFRGETPDYIPAAPHWWGVYKFQKAGLANNFDDMDNLPGIDAKALAEIDIGFYEAYKPDWFHLGTGPSCLPPDPDRDKQINDIIPAVRRLDSYNAIDEFISLISSTPEEIKASGIYEHVRIIASKYGDEVFIILNEGNPAGYILDPHGLIGFEEGMVALAQKPDIMGYLMYELYKDRLPHMKVLAEYGCHGYVGSETMISADLISPRMYRDIVFPSQEMFYRETRKLGIEPINYFLGDIVPLMPYINRLDLTALLVEESKKGFELDIVKIRKELAEHITLFGNLDSVGTLLFGNKEDVRQETLKQLEAARYGRFVMANGSPLTFDTPDENLRTMITTARGF